MSTGLKALGVIGAGAVLALGLSGSEPSSSNVSAPSSVVVPITKETNSVPPPAVSVPAPAPITKTAPKPTSNCHPGYSGCLKINAGDYDCASGSGNGPNYTGMVQVYGSDPFGLDRDNDGWGCE